MEKLKTLYAKINSRDKVLILMFIITRVILGILLFTCKTNLIYDEIHYCNIAHNGYTSEEQLAFFPLLPIIIKIFGYYGTLIINSIATILGAIIIDKLLIKNDKDEKTRTLTIFCFFISPISIFTILSYTEALFFLFTIISFYLFVEKKHYILMGIFIGCSVAIRSMGALLFFSIFIGMLCLWKQKELKFVDIIKTYIPATIISVLYPLYLQIQFGNWKAFVDVQYTQWFREKSSILKNFILQIKIITNQTHVFDDKNLTTKIVWKSNEILTIVIFVFIIILFILSLKYIKKDYINNIVMILYTLSSIWVINHTIRVCYGTPTVSYYRYYFAIFPLYIWLSNIKHKYIVALNTIICTLTILISIFVYSGIFFF